MVTSKPDEPCTCADSFQYLRRMYRRTEDMLGHTRMESVLHMSQLNAADNLFCSRTSETPGIYYSLSP